MESIHLAKSSQQTWQYTFAFKSVNFCDEKTGWKKMEKHNCQVFHYIVEFAGVYWAYGKLAIMCAE